MITIVKSRQLNLCHASRFWARSFGRITFFRNSSVVLSKFVSKEKLRSFEFMPRWSFLRRLFFEQTTKYIFEQTVKRIFLSLYIVQFVCLINVLSKFNFFEKTLIRKNIRKQRFLNERHSKEKNEFRKNVIQTNDLVP